MQREVKQHFQCNFMIGAEVENQEQSVRGTIHWEKRLFGVSSCLFYSCSDESSHCY